MFNSLKIHCRLHKLHNKLGRASHRHSHVADAAQEGADEALMFAADVLLKRGLQPILDVAHLQDPTGIPANSQVTQRGSQNVVFPLQLTRGAEV